MTGRLPLGGGSFLYHRYRHGVRIINCSNAIPNNIPNTAAHAADPTLTDAIIAMKSAMIKPIRPAALNVLIVSSAWIR
jgi:hypothetical protein